MFDILALGEILLRLSPPMNEKLVRGETFEKQVGGAELNVLSGASLLGLRAGIISKIAENDIGEFARNRVRFVGVSDDYLMNDIEKDARLGIYYYENGAYPRKPRIVAYFNVQDLYRRFPGHNVFADKMFSYDRDYPGSGRAG